MKSLMNILHKVGTESRYLLSDKVQRRRESKAKDTEKLNTDIEVKYMRMLEKMADGSRFRNKTHVVEVAIETLYDMVLASEEKER